MSKFIIKPKENLSGSVYISGSKNAALPAIAAAVLTDEAVYLENIPALSDIECMLEMISALGGSQSFKDNKATVFVPEIRSVELPYSLASQLRASVLFMAPLLSRAGCAKIPLPGGCRIGARPIDLHLKGLSLMGAKVELKNGFVEVRAPRLRGADIYLDFPSVGATENIMLAAVTAKGTTVIKNAASEPEIVCLIEMLSGMGAKISQGPDGTLIIEGVPRLFGIRHKIIPDRIEAGTYITAAAAVRGSVSVKNVIPKHLFSLTAKLAEMGVPMELGDSSVNIRPCGKIRNTDIKTLPYPGFPTDLQAPFSVLMSCASGTGIITETVFENRFQHLGELCRMGAKIKTDGRCAFISGTRRLSGAKTKATDLRSGAALVIAALCAEGESEVEHIEFIERGYECLDKKLTALGADILRV